MSDKTEELKNGLTEVTGSFADALTALEGAKRTAEEAHDHFMGLGGSADRAQSVVDLIEDLHREATSLEDLAEEANAAVDDVDHAITPDDNVAKLEIVIEKLKSAKDSTTAVVEACDDAVRETHEHLAGSSRADTIAGEIGEARDELDKGRTAMDGLTEEAKAQQEAFREGNE